MEKKLGEWKQILDVEGFPTVRINLSRGRLVGNPSAIDYQTVDIKNVRKGLWA